ncbi:cyclin-dependent kinase 4 inhibitor B-like isoform X2 [Ptychodera flava]|uniref:cyclin-dependent kinase 4 inhibitor B-like isoform X2 n=1 Tax=Ptychodera flava TaxID=63121 RepID=UPI00396A6343
MLDCIEVSFTPIPSLRYRHAMNNDGGHVQMSLAEAAARGDDGTVRDLLAQGCDVHERNRYNRTPIQAMNFSRVDIARLLLQRGADPNEGDSVRRAPIHDAAQAGYVDTLIVMAEYGANLELRDNFGNIPAHVTAMEGNEQALRYLSRGCDPLTRNNSSQSVIDLAQASSRISSTCITSIKEETQTLKHLCRLVIRRVCGRRINELDGLLPSQLVQYVKLQS